MNNIKVIINGLGGVGCRALRSICAREGMSIVGAVDVDPAKIGVDAGLVAGLEPIGVIVSPGLDELCRATEADVIINLASSAEAGDTFRQMLPAIERGMNVLVANSATFELSSGESELAELIDSTCKKHGVSYLGMGNTQSIERMIMLMTESVEDIKTLRFVHHADVSEFSPVSNANQLGISLKREEYLERLRDGRAPALVKWREDLVWSLGRRLGWRLDRVEYDRELKTDAQGLICENISALRAYVGDEVRISMDWVFLLDGEHRYFDRIVIDGVPGVDCNISFTPDRGKTATSNILVNAIAYIVGAQSGYISTFDVPPCTFDGAGGIWRNGL